MYACSDIALYAMHTEMGCSVVAGWGGSVLVAHMVRSDSVCVARKRNDDQQSV